MFAPVNLDLLEVENPTLVRSESSKYSLLHRDIAFIHEILIPYRQQASLRRVSKVVLKRVNNTIQLATFFFSM